MNNRDQRICDKLLAEIALLLELPDGMSCEAFLADGRTARAVCMALINIGELVKNFTPELRDAHPDIPWRAKSRMRHITAYKYQAFRMEDVYNTCAADIPDFEARLKALSGS